jgi:hypothetical protein
VLPFVEQDNLAKQMHVGDYPRFGGKGPNDLTGPESCMPADVPGGWTQTKLKLFRCPSDNGPDLNPIRNNHSMSNYRGVAGPYTYPYITENMDFGGIFYQNSFIHMTDITDGSSHTGFVAERACGITQGTWPGAISGARMRLGVANPAYALNPDQDYDPDLFGLIHTNWINAGTDQSDDGGTDDSSSFHVGGAYHLFGDGSVRFLKNTTGYRGAAPTLDRQAYWAIGTRADGDFPGAIEN